MDVDVMIQMMETSFPLSVLRAQSEAFHPVQRGAQPALRVITNRCLHLLKAYRLPGTGQYINYPT